MLEAVIEAEAVAEKVIEELAEKAIETSAEAPNGASIEVAEKTIESVADFPKWYDYRESLEDIRNFQDADKPLHELSRDVTSEFRKPENDFKSFEERAVERPCYNDHDSRLTLLKNRIEPALKDVEGYKSLREKTLSSNSHSARGYYAELINAYRAKEADLKVLALDKIAYNNKGQKTDIDLYAETPSGKRIVMENKDVRGGIVNDDSFKRKIDLLAGKMYDRMGKEIKKDEAVFINSKGISKEAMQYALDKGVHIKQNMDGHVRKGYFNHLATKMDDSNKKV
ncbi:MAG: hypothetical protein RBS43_01130 [Candidatus Cloacimonas sp.]|jgi:hypothetical protein|nr:hypothetical protein [Candidatus Cloacimonas sp.]